eukprot:482886_1
MAALSSKTNGQTSREKYIYHEEGIRISEYFESGNIKKLEQYWKAKGSIELKKGDAYSEHTLYYGEGFEYISGIYRLAMDSNGAFAQERLQLPIPKGDYTKFAFRLWDIVKFIEQDTYAKKQAR